MGNKVTLTGRVLEMEGAAIKRLLPYDLLTGIQAVDDHPFFAEFVVGHEGASHGQTIVGSIAKRVKKLWSREVVDQLADKVRGAFVSIKGHDPVDDRVQQGQVVHSFVSKGREGRYEAHGIAYIKGGDARNKITQGDLNTCSVEADIEFTVADAGHYIVNAIQNVPWLVLEKRSNNEPGFPGASLLATVQMLNEKEGGMGDELTKGQVLRFIEEKGLNPSEIFSRIQLAGDQKVKGIVKDATDEAVGNLDEKVEAAKKEAAGDLDAAQKKVKELESQVGKTKIRKDAEPLIKEALDGRNLTAAMAEEISAQVLDDMEGIEVEEGKLKEAVDVQIEKKIKIIEAAGHEVAKKKDAKGDDKDEKDEPKAPKFPTRDGGSSGKDLSDPDNNPLIPQVKKK